MSARLSDALRCLETWTTKSYFCCYSNLRYDIPCRKTSDNVDIQEQRAQDMEKIRELTVFLGVAFATFASCLFSASAEMKPWQLGVPEPVSPVAVRIHEFHDYLLWLITAITIFVLALLVLSLIHI